ncbi:MAG TPA: SHOCT domain-containing protein [Solirubrobacteraceae bacterium]|nr:SHOCT domain-containing protein [Solirubrobacteraceae bacterium]
MTLAATSYPLLEVFWTMLIFFGFIVWIWILFTIFADIFRRRDINGWIKFLWIIFVVFLPFLGVLVYLVANHQGMTDRSIEGQKAAQSQFDEYVRQAAGTTDPAAQISHAKELLDSGTITQQEFDEIKRKALASA